MLALHKTGSFSAAAESCFVTQSTLSTMIKKLENQLDLILFDRKTKPIKLSQEGLQLIDQFILLSNEYDHLKERIEDIRKEFHGTLHIGIIPTLAPFLLPLFLQTMTSKHPGIVFSINEMTTMDIVAKIKRRELDVGILSLPINDPGITETSLFIEEFLLYDTHNIGKKNKKYAINEIDVNRLWLLEEGHCMTNQIEKICHLRRKQRTQPNLVFNSGSILSLIELVKMNKGLTLLPKLALERSHLIEEKYIHKLESPVPVREIGLVSHPNAAKKRFLTIIEKEIKVAVKPFLHKNQNTRLIKPY